MTQLPPALADWLRAESGVDATAVRDLGLREATDAEIHIAARDARAVVVTKDSDFLALLEQLGTPPQVVWITIGNCSNEHLKMVLREKWPVAAELLENGEPLVEIGTAE